MRQYFILTIALIFVCACGQPTISEEVLKPKLTQYFSQYIKAGDSTLTLDSLRLIRLDTITSQKRFLIKMGAIADSVNNYLKLFETRNREIEDNLKQLKLVRGVNNELFLKYNEQVNEGLAQAKLYEERTQYFIRLKDSLIKRSDYADRVKPVDFEAVCVYQVRRKEGGISRDTGYVYVNKNLDIISRKEYVADL